MRVSGSPADAFLSGRRECRKVVGVFRLLGRELPNWDLSAARLRELKEKISPRIIEMGRF